MCWSSSMSTDLYCSFSALSAASTLLPAAASLSSWISVNTAECRSAISQYRRQWATARILEARDKRRCDLNHSAMSRGSRRLQRQIQMSSLWHTFSMAWVAPSSNSRTTSETTRASCFCAFNSSRAGCFGAIWSVMLAIVPVRIALILILRTVPFCTLPRFFPKTNIWLRYSR